MSTTAPRPRPPRLFRLTPNQGGERELHESLARVLNLLLMSPAFWFAYPAGHVQLSPAQMARLVRIGLKRGLPDILVVYDGRIYGLELKRPGARLSTAHLGRSRSGAPRLYEGQVDVFPRLMAAGMAIGVAHSVDEALAQLRAWNIPLRDHA